MMDDGRRTTDIFFAIVLLLFALLASWTAPSAALPATVSFISRFLAVGHNPGRAVFIVAHHHIGGQDGLFDLRFERIGDGRGHAVGDGHGQKYGVQGATVG